MHKFDRSPMLRNTPKQQSIPHRKRERHKHDFLSAFAYSISALLALGLLGCDSSKPMNTSSTPSTPLVEVSAADAKAAGLPAVGVRVAKTTQPLMPRRLPSADTYVALSGPPGGPLGMTVTAGSANILDAAKSLRDGGHQDLQTGQVSLGGKSSPAIASTLGQSNARRQELRVLAATAEGKGVWITIVAPPPDQSSTPAQLATASPFSEMLGAVQVKVP